MNVGSKPAHVPDNLVYDFDMFLDEGLAKDPHSRLADLGRSAPPLFWTPRNGGHWYTTRNDIVSEIYRDPLVYSANIFLREPSAPDLYVGDKRVPNGYPINVDPPLHADFRKPLNAPFSAGAMVALRAHITDLARGLLNRVAPLGRTEFMDAIAGPLAVHVFLEIFGVDPARRDELSARFGEQLEFIDLEAETVPLRLAEAATILRPIIAEKASHPQNDVLSTLWKSDIAGRRLNQEMIEDYGVVLLLAGLDTVKNSMGFLVIHLARNPDLQQALRDNPKL